MQVTKAAMKPTNIQASQCVETILGCERMLAIKTRNSPSEKTKAISISRLNLLHELNIVGKMTVEIAYDEYLGMLPAKFHPNYKFQKDAVYNFLCDLLSKNGMPVIVINCATSRFMMLWDRCSEDNTQRQFNVLNNILSKEMCKCKQQQELIASHFHEFVALLTGARDRAIVLSIMTQLFSTTKIRHLFKIAEHRTVKIRDDVKKCIDELQEVEGKLTQECERKVEDLITSLEESLKKDMKSLEKSNMSAVEKQCRFEDVDHKQQRIRNLKLNPKTLAKATALREVKKWKDKQFSKTGTGTGHHLIDRGAEKEIYDVLQEQLVAHKSRKGCPLAEQRITWKEMRCIANNYLKTHGKRLIRSYETARSFGTPRNTRSIQAKQHRGQGLWSHKRAKKNYVDAHVNIHYNRAHVKMYTRLIFSQKTSPRFKKLSVRRCIDDKAYLRCGTSEGFSRPRHAPLAVDGETSEIPAYDFPQQAGYVAPGVNLIIKDMHEIQHDGRDKYVTDEVAISVTCKPKLTYPSSPTHWANDMYSDRLLYPEEHEIKETGMQGISRRDMNTLVVARDSCKQFLLMNIKEDFMRITAGGLHLEREQVRLDTIINRISLDSEDMKGVPPHVIQELTKSKTYAMDLLNVLSVGGKDTESIEARYLELEEHIKTLSEALETVVPRHRPIDVQTSDAGPGVGTSEELVRLRLTEQFLIHDLSLQARFHYAPRDSKSHKVEQVMSSLNEATGDGRFIDLPQNSTLSSIGHDQILQMTQKEIEEQEKIQEKEAAQVCAEKVAERYQGTRCMHTCIHSKTPDNLQFFFDEKYLKLCHESSKSKLKLLTCAGSHYYEFLKEWFTTYYIRYDNGVEAVRNGMERVPPPVPDLSTRDENGKWHYHTPESLPEEFRVAEVREVDDFCPRAQLKKMMNDIGTPEIDTEVKENGTISLRDQNNTFEKIQQALPGFAEKYTGQDLKDVIQKEADNMMIKMLKKEKKRTEAHIALTKSVSYSVQKESSKASKITIKKSCIPAPLPWDGSHLETEFTNTCTIDNMLYFFHVLQHEKESVREAFKESRNHVENMLYEIHNLFKQKKWAEGKYIWATQVLNLQMHDEVNLLGGEDEYFFNHIQDAATTAFKSVCNSKKCPEKVSLIVNKQVSYSAQSAEIDTLQKAINKWVANQKQVACNKQGCEGTRKYHPRQFVSGLPEYFAIELELCPWQGTLPVHITLKQQKYQLRVVTYGNGHHFKSSICYRNKWYLYDGLREYHEPGTGVWCQAKAKAPPRYHPDYCLYVKC